MNPKRFYGTGLPHVDPALLAGTLIVLEGPDGSGRSTQIALLRDGLERRGVATMEVGLKRSELAGDELDRAMEGNTLCPFTLSLFYATDFADQLEKIILPALRSGFTVLADRYIYSLMARAIVRGVDPRWIRGVYDIALVPDAVFYLEVPPRVLAERTFRKNGLLDFWESGMDIRRSGNMLDCFVHYQQRLRAELDNMRAQYPFVTIDGDRTPQAVHLELMAQIERVLAGREPKAPAAAPAARKRRLRRVPPAPTPATPAAPDAKT
jgi:dTMP kinase